MNALPGRIYEYGVLGAEKHHSFLDATRMVMNALPGRIYEYGVLGAEKHHSFLDATRMVMNALPGSGAGRDGPGRD